MESNSMDVSNILTEIKSVENRLLSQLKGNEYNDNIISEKDLIIKSQKTRIAELENEVMVLQGQIDNFNNQKDNPDELTTNLELNAPVHYVKFSNNIKSKSILTKKYQEKIESVNKGEDFSHLIVDNVDVISVNLIRATVENAISFKKYLNRFIVKNSELILDLTECVFIDSTFMGVIVSALKSSMSLNGDIRIVLNDETESVIFYVTRMDNVFKIYKSIDDAVDSYKNNKESLILTD